MIVKKSDGLIEDYDVLKVKNGIRDAYTSCGETVDNGVIESISANLIIYDKIETSEIRRQVEDALISVNKKVAKAYIKKYDVIVEGKKQIKKKNDFINNYIKASNAATGSKFDSNANVVSKNVVTMGQEMYKDNNIRQNRWMIRDKMKSMYNKKLADSYISDLESHRLYKHDETAIPGMPYTYSAKEVIEVKYNNRHLLLPFDLLWTVLDEQEILVNQIDDVYQKNPTNLLVKDNSNKFTKVTVITKKLRKRDLVRIKTSFGEDVIVTDNHPMIVNIDDVNDTVEAINSEGYTQYKINDTLNFGDINKIDISKYPDTIDSTELYCLDYNSNVCKRYLEIDEKIGYIVGFFVGDGNYNNSNGSITYTQKNKDTLVKLNNLLFEKLGIVGKIRYKKDKYKCYTLTISSGYLWWLFSDVFKIQDKSENKTLPYNILEYTEEFSNGVLCGLIDADGSVNDCQLSIRLSSRSAIVQATALLRHFKYGVGNTVQNLPFDNNDSYNTNYTIWGVNCSVRKNSVPLIISAKINNVRISDSSLKYKKDGETKITSVTKIDENDSFLELNNYIYDITTETRTFACNNLLVHNCVAITMYPYLVDGLTKLGGSSTKPTDLKSYCGGFVNLVYSVSSQFAGACATPEFLMYMDYFIRNDYGQDYLTHLSDKVEYNKKERSLEKVIENCFQQVVHSMNMPAGNRG